MAITNTHEIDIISQIRLPDGKTYEIHDPNAIHDIADLNLSSVFKYKGAVESVQDLPASAEVGDVYHILNTGKEYVWVSKDNVNEWEVLGTTYDAASSTHTHTVTVTGENEGSDVTGKVTIPTYTAKTGYLGIGYNGNQWQSNTTSVLKGDTKFSVNGGEANTTKINNPSVTDVDIPSVTSEDIDVSLVGVSEGDLPEWHASVTDGVLSFNFIAGTKPPIVSSTQKKVSKVTVGTGAKASKVTVTEKEVATGVTPITVVAEANSTVDVVEEVYINGSPFYLKYENTEFDGSQKVVSGVDIGAAEVDLTGGRAMAQKWKQNSGSTSAPIDN